MKTTNKKGKKRNLSMIDDIWSYHERQACIKLIHAEFADPHHNISEIELIELRDFVIKLCRLAGYSKIEEEIKAMTEKRLEIIFCKDEDNRQGDIE